MDFGFQIQIFPGNFGLCLFITPQEFMFLSNVIQIMYQGIFGLCLFVTPQEYYV